MWTKMPTETTKNVVRPTKKWDLPIAVKMTAWAFWYKYDQYCMAYYGIMWVCDTVCVKLWDIHKVRYNEPLAKIYERLWKNLSVNWYRSGPILMWIIVNPNWEGLKVCVCLLIKSTVCKLQINYHSYLLIHIITCWTNSAASRSQGFRRGSHGQPAGRVQRKAQIVAIPMQQFHSKTFQENSIATSDVRKAASNSTPQTCRECAHVN